jgi:hypothetical protein
MWLLGSLPSVVAAAFTVGESIVGRAAVRAALGMPLIAGTTIGLILFATAAFTTESPATKVAWLTVRASQLACWAAGALMSAARILDV